MHIADDQIPRNAPSEADFRRTLDAAKYFRSLGLQPLPSRMDAKRPLLKEFAQYWLQKAPDEWYTCEAWRTTNIQLMTGVAWRLAVVDLDGPEAAETWANMAGHFGCTRNTWIARTGSGGWHLYFRLPAWLDECPSKVCWSLWDTWAGTRRDLPGSPPRGGWVKHREIRLLGDGSLVVAPPSIHVSTNRPYRWASGHSPDDISRPEEIPAWLLRMPPVESPATDRDLAPIRITHEKAPNSPSRRQWDRQEVLDAIPDKAAVARRWGLRIARRQPNANGWLACHAYDRRDDTPSSSFHAFDGVYWDGRQGERLSLFDLGVALGAYEDWTEALNALGDEFCSHTHTHA